jgi:Leucine-rich repeat (LRR) protein
MRLWSAAKSIQKSLRGTGVQVELDNKFDRQGFGWDEQRTIARMQTWASFTTIAIKDSYKVAMEEATEEGMPGIWWLEGVLAKCSALVNLDLSHNYIEQDGMEKLARVLRHCQRLKHLDLSTNMMMDDGVKMVAGVLPHCEALESLSLYNNCISDKGGAELAGVLGQCKRLTHIDLIDNCIGDEGARMLAGALQHCDKPVEMDLRYNEIGDGMKLELEKLGHVYV